MDAALPLSQILQFYHTAPHLRAQQTVYRLWYRFRKAVMVLGNVLFIDSVSKDEVPRYWSLLDVSIIHLKKTDLFTTVIPSKMFECMGMGIPILHGVAGESAEIVEREGAGLVFEPENAKELRDKLLLLRDDADLYARLKKNGLAAAGHYDRSVLAARMLDILMDTAKENIPAEILSEAKKETRS